MGCCTGSNFTPAPDAALDPLQRVNYTFGMVLGVDDFRQEHAYLAARDERALRETIGYGVITGLGVSAPKPDPGSAQQVRVTPGLALMPDGRLVGVAADQCANLTAWLNAEKARDPATEANTTVYVRLRFAESSGSPVPIPGEPCRDESELSADARILDSFSLDFSWTPPDASEDLALRAAVAWIRNIKVRPSAPPGQTLQTFQQQVELGLPIAIKAAWGTDLSHPGPAMPAAVTPTTDPSPSPNAEDLVIPRAEAAAYYAAAFEVWTRLMRSGFMAHHGPVPAAVDVAEHAILLAAIDAKAPSGTAPAVRMLGRPQLLHLRLLQEWLLRDGSQDAPREAHYVLGKGDPELDHAQDLLLDFAGNDHAMTRIDIVPDVTDGGSGSKAVIVPAVKWPGNGSGGGPDYYGPGMEAPIPVADGGTGQNVAPETGALLVGRAASGSEPARFELGSLVGADLPKPEGASPNILVDATGEAPTIRLDTVQDIGPDASPVFAGLDLSGGLTVGGNVSVTGTLSVDGEVTLGGPLSSVLATDENGVITAARVWDGDESALDAEPPTPYVYAPGQGDGEKGAAVRIEDGGTGLTQRPRHLQVLVGVEPQSLRSPGGDYVLATLRPGSNADISLNQGEGGDWQLVIDAGGGASTQVVAAGGATAPANLTAVTADNVVTIDTVQGLHEAASPQFAALSLTNMPIVDAPDAIVGWRKKDKQLVLTQGGGATDVGRWPIRYVDKPEGLAYQDGDMVLAVLVAGELKLPNPRLSRLGDGRVLVIRNVLADKLTLSGLTMGRDNISISLEMGQSVTVVSALGLPFPGWLIIGRG